MLWEDQPTDNTNKENAVNPNHTNVTAVIPTDLLPQFYRWVADAHDQQSLPPGVSPQRITSNDSADTRIDFSDTSLELIQAWWSKLTETAHDVFVFLAHNAEERFTSADLVDEIEALTSISAAAGTFAWPARYAKKMGFEGPWSWDGETYSIFSNEAEVLLAALNPAAE